MYKFFLLIAIFAFLGYAQELPDSLYTFEAYKNTIGSITTDHYEPIAESLYVYPTKPIVYKFEFKNNFDSLIIYGDSYFTDTDTLRCVYDSTLAASFYENTPSINYLIMSGTFSGGVIHILHMTSPAQVDMRIFGSGVPIIRSEVGNMHNETAITVKPNNINSNKSKITNTTLENFYLPNGRALKNFNKQSFIGRKNVNDYIILHKE